MMQDDAGKTPETPRWKWDGGDRFSIGGRMYVGAEVAELLDRYEQQDRMKTREINLIVPENKALEAKAKRIVALEAALRGAQDRFGAIGRMSAWTDSTLEDAGDEARENEAKIKALLSPSEAI